MSATEDKSINTLIETWRQTKAERDASRLYSALLAIGLEMLPKYLKYRIRYYNEDQQQEIVHDAIARLIMRIKGRPSYQIKHIRTVIRLELMYRIDDRRLETSDYDWNTHHSQFPDLDDGGDFSEKYLADSHEEAAIPNEKNLIDEILEHPEGKRIIIDIYGARTFKELCLNLETYVRMQWILDHAYHLVKIYKYSRREAWTRHLIRRSRNTSALTLICTRASRHSSKTTPKSDSRIS